MKRFFWRSIPTASTPVDGVLGRITCKKQQGQTYITKGPYSDGSSQQKLLKANSEKSKADCNCRSLTLRERSLTIVGGRAGIISKVRAQKFPFRLTAQKSCLLQKFVPKKLYPSPNNILSIRMLHREDPYQRNFETTISLEQKSVTIYNIFRGRRGII